MRVRSGACTVAFNFTSNDDATYKCGADFQETCQVVQVAVTNLQPYPIPFGWTLKLTKASWDSDAYAVNTVRGAGFDTLTAGHRPASAESASSCLTLGSGVRPAACLAGCRQLCLEPACRPELTRARAQWWNCDYVNLSGPILSLTSNAQWQQLLPNGGNTGECRRPGRGSSCNNDKLRPAESSGQPCASCTCCKQPLTSHRSMDGALCWQGSARCRAEVDLPAAEGLGYIMQGSEASFAGFTPDSATLNGRTCTVL